VNQRARKGRVSRRGRERHVRVGLLVVIAIGIASVLMAGLAAQAVVTRSTCDNHPLTVNVAVSDDIAPAVQIVAQLFNRQDHQAAGQCVEAKVTQEDPAAVVAAVDGTSSNGRLPAPDAWIPDSSLWIGAVRTLALGAQRAQPTGITVARSPLMIVMPPAAAAQIPGFNNSVGWSFLLPPDAGGPTSSQQVRVDLPDPTQSAVGLATLIEVSRLLGSGTAAARTSLTTFVRSAESSAQFGNAASLATFVTQANPPLDAHPVTVTSEQAVLSYDAAHPDQPLAARYPTGPSAALGTPELDYPYVVTSTDPAEVTAAQEFGNLLRQGYTAALVRHYGFRSADGTTGTLPAGDGLAQQTLQLAPSATSVEAQTALGVWGRLQSGSRDLALMDTSSSMQMPSGLPGVTLEQELTQTATLGLGLFPDSTQIGMWDFADHLNGSLPYRQLVSVGPLPGEMGLISRRQQLQQIDMSLRPLANTPAALNQTILAAYQQMVATYQPNYTNAVIVMTAGVDNAPGDVPVATLVSKLRALYNPSRPVELIIVMLGSKGNFPAMQQIAAAGGGAAYPVTDPTQVGKIFFEATARRICQGSSCGTS
jgi:Bacterial extracellular solute-binding protein/von Willebrand factor type A domain